MTKKSIPLAWDEVEADPEAEARAEVYARPRPGMFRPSMGESMAPRVRKPEKVEKAKSAPSTAPELAPDMDAISPEFVLDKQGRPVIVFNKRIPVAARLRTVSARSLLAHPPEKPLEIIPGLVPSGLSLLASAPKVGKSWLAYQEAVAVAIGGEVLGRRAIRGDVLYLALEDGEYRAWDRITQVLRAQGLASMPVGAELELAFLAGRGDALVDQVEDFLAVHPNARLVLVDTLQRIRPGSSGRRNQYELDVEDVGRVLGITKRHPQVALQVVHHDTKASHAPGSDFVDAISGTSGIGGSVDAILVLRRKRHEATGTLETTGKDIKEELIHVAYDTDAPYWTVDLLGGMTEAQLNVYRAILANGAMGSTALGRALDITQQAAYEIAEKLLDQGAVVKLKGTYQVPHIVHILPVEPVVVVEPVMPVMPVEDGQVQQAQQAGTHGRVHDSRPRTKKASA